MDYAVISLRNNQYLIKPGEKITSLGILGNVGDIVTDVKTLLVKNDTLEIGTPNINFPITLKIVEITKTDKIDIFKYRAKSRYRRHTGHRQAQTVLEVVIPQTKVAKAKPIKKVVNAK